MRSLYERHKKALDQLLVFFLTLIAALLFFKYAFGIFAPFILALILTLVISPAVDFLDKKARVPRVVATVFSMVVVLSALGFLVSFVLRLISLQFLSFAEGFPGTLERVTQMFRGFQQSYYNFFEIIPEDMRGFFDSTIITVADQTALWAGNMARNLSLSAVKGIPKMFVFMIITIISTFFMIKDKWKMSAFVVEQFPDNVKKTAVILKKDIFGALWGYIKAQMILMCFSGTIAIIGLTVMGYEYSLLIGLFIAFFDALPLFGPGFVLWPWAAAALITGDYSYAVGLVVLYLLIMLCRQMLEPKVLSSQIGLHPLVTLISLYAGLMLLGAAGLIVGPLLAIITRSLQNAGLLPNWKQL